MVATYTISTLHIKHELSIPFRSLPRFSNTYSCLASFIVAPLTGYLGLLPIRTNQGLVSLTTLSN